MGENDGALWCIKSDVDLRWKHDDRVRRGCGCGTPPPRPLPPPHHNAVILFQRRHDSVVRVSFLRGSDGSDVRVRRWGGEGGGRASAHEYATQHCCPHLIVAIRPEVFHLQRQLDCLRTLSEPRVQRAQPSSHRGIGMVLHPGSETPTSTSPPQTSNDWGIFTEDKIGLPGWGSPCAILLPP